MSFKGRQNFATVRNGLTKSFFLLELQAKIAAEKGESPEKKVERMEVDNNKAEGKKYITERIKSKIQYTFECFGRKIPLLIFTK